MGRSAMTLRRLFHYATWAVFMVTGTLFVTSLVQNEERKRGGGGPDSSSVRVDPASPSPRNHPIHVEVYEFGFAPTKTVIKAGQAIAFRNVGKQIHNIVPASDASAEYFRDADNKGSARPLFPKPGTYTFTCSLHPQMDGKVEVVQDF